MYIMIVFSIGAINDQLFYERLFLFWIIHIFKVDLSCTITSFTDDSEHSTIEDAIEQCAFSDIETFYFSGIKCSDISFEDSLLFY